MKAIPFEKDDSPLYSRLQFCVYSVCLNHYCQENFVSQLKGNALLPLSLSPSLFLFSFPSPSLRFLSFFLFFSPVSFPLSPPPLRFLSFSPPFLSFSFFSFPPSYPRLLFFYFSSFPRFLFSFSAPSPSSLLRGKKGIKERGKGGKVLRKGNRGERERG